MTIDSSTKSGLRGLPAHIENRLLGVFTKEEIMHDPDKVIQCIIESKMTDQPQITSVIQSPQIKSYQGGIPGSSSLVDFNNPSVINLPEEVQELNAEKIFKREDPSKYYEVICRMAKGSQGQVFKLKRLVDDKHFALKFIQPNDLEEYNNIKREVALMMMCEDENTILKCYDAYDFKERLWVILELMDVGALTDIVEELKGEMSENVCAYILRKVLEAICYLHKKGIVHRDIKSDNILINEKGEIKLADFGFAT